MNQDTAAPEGLVRVYSTASIVDGHLARARLEAEGIPVMLKGEGEGPYRMGPVHLFVPDDLEVQAKLILEKPPEPLTDEEFEEAEAELEAEGAALEVETELDGDEPG